MGSWPAKLSSHRRKFRGAEVPLHNDGRLADIDFNGGRRQRAAPGGMGGGSQHGRGEHSQRCLDTLHLASTSENRSSPHWPTSRRRGEGSCIEFSPQMTLLRCSDQLKLNSKLLRLEEEFLTKRVGADATA